MISGIEKKNRDGFKLVFYLTCSLDSAIERLNIPEYAIYLLRDFELDTVYIDSNNLINLGFTVEDMSDLGLSMVTKEENVEEVMLSNMIINISLEFQKVTNSENPEDSLSRIKDKMLSLIYSTKGKNIKHQFLDTSIRYLDEYKDQFPEYEILKIEFEPYYLELKDKKKEPNNLFNGKKLNLCERFEMANEILGLQDNLDNLEIPEEEKYVLISYIFNCGYTSARKLATNKYGGYIKDDVKTYIELKKNKLNSKIKKFNLKIKNIKSQNKKRKIG